MADKDGDWIQVEPKEYLPCSLGVVVPAARIDELGRVEKEAKEHHFTVRAILSDHVPLAGGMRDILERPSYHLLAVNEHKLSIYLHHGGNNAVFYDLVSGDPNGRVDHIEVAVWSRYPSNCFWSARTAVSQLLDTIIRRTLQPLTIRRMDLHLEGDDHPLCHQLVLPFDEGVRWGPLGGFHQYAFLSPYEALIREAITNGSPYYRLLCAYRLYEGLGPLRKILRDLAKRTGIDAPSLPKPPDIDVNLLRGFGIHESILSTVKNAEDFWKKSAELRHGAAHFLLEGQGPLSLSDGPSYHEYSVVGAVLLHYANMAFRELHGYTAKHFGSQLTLGSILATVENRDLFVLRPDAPIGETSD